ncbi:stathmin-like [Teleopsis dalmanni]|uniref:stathmin-like n=1 Tax=Teleopsis dalmanni TaxID=139649 RepID=UPI0018CDDA78|nr:stathmin-like [Teleopsis dalmanni]
MVQTADRVVAVDDESNEATEIHCQKKSHGGLSYEVILAEIAPNVTVPKHPVTPGKNVSAEEIEQKLMAAEERRVLLEQKKMAALNNKFAKIEEAKRKKDEIANEFINQMKEQLESKMEYYVEKREDIFSDLKKKLNIDSQEIEKLMQQKISEKVPIEGKLKSALSLNDDYIDKMLERLKDLNANKIAEIKNQIDQLESQKIASYNIN